MLSFSSEEILAEEIQKNPLFKNVWFARYVDLILKIYPPSPRDPDTLGSGTGSPKHGNFDPETQNPENRTLKIEPVTQIPNTQTFNTHWINLSCEANFNNKKLSRLSPKRRCSSRWTKTFTKIFWPWNKTKHLENI